MLKKTTLALSLAMISLWLPLSRAADVKVPWIHLEVKEGHDQEETVKVNLPLSMLETAMDVVQNEHFHKGHFRMHTRCHLSVADIKNLWNELRKAGDAEFVTVEKKDETVRIAKSGNYLTIKVTESKGKKNQVDIKVPVAVMDALFSGEGEELDIKAALQSLQKADLGEVLTVTDDHTHVKLWID